MPYDKSPGGNADPYLRIFLAQIMIEVRFEKKVLCGLALFMDWYLVYAVLFSQEVSPNRR